MATRGVAEINKGEGIIKFIQKIPINIIFIYKYNLKITFINCIYND